MSGYAMLLLAMATYVLCFAAWTLMGALAPMYRESLQLSSTQTGWLFFLLGRSPVEARTSPRGGLRGIVKSRGAWLLGFFYLVTFGGFLALSVHLSTVLVDAYALSPVAAGSHVALFAVVGTFARPLGGYVADRIGARRVLYGVFPAVAALALVMALEPAHVTGVGVIFALGAGNGAVTKPSPTGSPTTSGP